MLRARTWITLVFLVFSIGLPPAYRSEGDVGIWRRAALADSFAGVAASNGALWAVGEGGLILKSASPWRRLPAPVAANLAAVAAWDERTVAAVGANGAVLLTTDGGRTWARAQHPDITGPDLTGINLTGVAFADAHTLVVVGGGGLIATSADPATANSTPNSTPNSWTVRYAGTDEDLNAVAARGGLVVAAGDNGTLLVSNDGGRSWRRVREAALAGRHLAAVAASPEGGPFYCVGEGGLVATADNPYGPWSVRASGGEGCLRAVCAASARAAYCVGEGGAILWSEDAGASWWSAESGTRRTLSGVACDVGLVAVVGDGLLLASEGVTAPGKAPVFASALPELLAAGGSESGGVWLSGEGGTLLSDTGGGLTFQLPPPQLGQFEGLSALYAANGGLWARTEAGRILRAQPGGGFEQERTPFTPYSLSGRLTGGRPELFAVTEAGEVLRRAPVAGYWEAEPEVKRVSFGRPLRGVWAAPDDPATPVNESLVVAVGDRLTIVYRSGDGGWQRLDLTPDQRRAAGLAGDENLEAVWGSGTAVFAVGEGSGGRGVLLRLDLSRPDEPRVEGRTVAPEGRHSALFRAVWAAGPRLAFAVGGGGLWRYEAGSWRREELPGGLPGGGPVQPGAADLRAVWGTGPEDVWAVGARGAIFHFTSA